MVIKSKVFSIDKKVLLVDIGGTNIRTATAEIGSFELQNTNKQNLDSLDSFDEIIKNLLNEDVDINSSVMTQRKSPQLRRIGRDAVSGDEIRNNRRARSAWMRIVEKIK